MQEVRVQMHDLRRQFRREHQRLAEAPHPVRRHVADKIAQEFAPRRAIAGLSPRPAPAAPYAPRLLVEILGQVQQRRADLPVHRMDRLVGRVTQGGDRDVEPPRLERRDLLRDKSLGETRIPFEHKGDTGHALRRAPSRSRPARS